MTRRQFTSTLASAALLAPFMHVGRARAAGGPINKLLLMATISPVRLNWNLADPNSFLFGPAMAAIKDKTLLFDGLPQNDTSANHGHPGALTGATGGPVVNSIDAAIAKGMGGNYAIPNMVMGTGGKAADNLFFWKDGVQAPDLIGDPNTAFQLAFGSSGGGSSSPSPGGNASGVDPATQMRRRSAILDLLADDITALEGQNLNDADQAKMISHRQSAEQLRNRVTGNSGGGAGGSGGGTPSACSPALGQFDPGNSANVNATLLQVGTEALICGVTPVVGVSFGTQQGYTATSYDPSGPTFNGDTHGGFVHGGAPDKGNLPYETWCATQFANAVTTLAKAPGSAGGTMLDETIVLWARDMGDGLAHNSMKMPYVMAGGKGYFGYSATGRTLDLSSSANGRTHEAFLRTIAAAMGVASPPGFGIVPNAPLVTELKQ